MKDVDKNLEILTLRHRLAILQRQIDRHRHPARPGGPEDFPDRRRGGLDAEGGQLAVDSPIAPACVLFGQSQDEDSDAANGLLDGAGRLRQTRTISFRPDAPTPTVDQLVVYLDLAVEHATGG